MKNPFRHSPEVADLLEKVAVYRDENAKLSDLNAQLRQRVREQERVLRLQTQAITNIGVSLKALAEQLSPE